MKPVRHALAFAAALAVLAGAGPAAAGTYEGRLEIDHSDDFAHGKSSTRYALVKAGRRYRLVPTRAPAVPSGTRVEVRGRRSGGAIRGRVQPAHARAADHTVRLGQRKTAVLLFNFAEDTREPWTPEYVRQRVFTDSNSVNAFYREESYDQVELVGKERADGDVYGWYTIAAPRTGCDYRLWATQARAAATADGADLSGYDHVIYAFPRQGCAWAGLGELGEDESWLNQYLYVSVIAHELGHNMGLHHASSTSCSHDGAPAAIGASCRYDEYGDPFDAMGNNGGPRHSHAWHLQKLGYITSSNVRTVTTSGTYTVRSAISQSTEPQLLRVARLGRGTAVSGAYYYLDFRSSGGVFDNFPPTSPAVQGVTVRAMDEPAPHPFVRSLLVDTTPGSPSGAHDAPLAVGRTFSDGVVHITTTAIDGQNATVQVTFADTLPPSRPPNLRGTGGEDGTSLTWSPSFDNVGIAGYEVYRDGELVGSAGSTSYTDAAAGPGSTHSYEVVAYDAAGNRSPRSGEHVVAIPAPEPPEPGPEPPAPLPAPAPVDTTAPAVRLRGIPAARRSRRTLSLRASASDAAGVVRIELWIDGVRRKVVAGSALNHRWKPSRRGRRHRIVVRAYDPSGNVGTARTRIRR